MFVSRLNVPATLTKARHEPTNSRGVRIINLHAAEISLQATRPPRTCVSRLSRPDGSAGGPVRQRWYPAHDPGSCRCPPPGSARRNIRSAAAAHLSVGHAGTLRRPPDVARRPTRSPSPPLRKTDPPPSVPNHQMESAVPHSIETG